MKVSHITFLYFLINSVLLPGIAVPSGTNLITFFFGDQPVQFNVIVKNYYGYSNVNFFVTMLIQKIFLSMFGQLTLIGLLIHYYLSPTQFLFFKKFFNTNFYYLMLRESATFNFGYYLSLNMIVFAVSIIYATHTPIITLIGLVYLYLRMIFDCHMFLNIYKNEVES